MTEEQVKECQEEEVEIKRQGVQFETKEEYLAWKAKEIEKEKEIQEKREAARKLVESELDRVLKIQSGQS